ncbi:MAG: membrane or secreted protein [Pirellulaceae bacterium]
MRFTLPFCCALAILALFSGCGRSRPLLWPVGPVEQQRRNASLHDPYSDNDIGPEVVGGRPREFQKPRPEPVRNEWRRSSFWGR